MLSMAYSSFFLYVFSIIKEKSIQLYHRLYCSLAELETNDPVILEHRVSKGK
jgi:hypothetical protein